MNESIKKNRPVHFRSYSFMLLAGEWKKWFPEEQYKLMIALALNECICNDEPGSGNVAISGYLFTGRSIYVVFNIRHTGISRVLDFFYGKVKEAILQELNRWYQLPGYAETREQHAMVRMNEIKLFEKLPIADAWLVQLITGNPVSPGYYDPALARLKRMIREEKFCSAIDYAGGESPVLVKKEGSQVPDE